MRDFSKKDFESQEGKSVSIFKPKNKYTFLQAMTELYLATLDLSQFTEVHTVPELYDFVRFTYKSLGQDESLIKCDRTLIKPNWIEDKDTIIHLATSGKDSTATLLKYLKDFNRNIAFHVRGVNKSYPTEYQKATKLYNSIDGVEYIEVKAQFPQVKNQSESPIKTLYLIVLACEATGIIPKWMTLGGANIFDISETQVFGDTSKSVNPFMEVFNSVTGADMKMTPWLETQEEAYRIIETSGISPSELGSCMCGLHHKKTQQNFTINKYTKKIDNIYYLAGSYKGKSIFNMSEQELNTIDVKDLEKVDILTSSDYRCTSCFKCGEQKLVYSRHYGYSYHPEAINRAERLLIEWMDKSPNSNKVNLTEYFDKVLKIPLSRIPVKYHEYLNGKAIRPDGWKEPKAKKSSK